MQFSNAKLLCILVFCLFFNNNIFAQKPDSVKIIIGGDIMGHGPQIRAAFDKETGEYSYDECFQYIKPYIQSADIAIANLEVTLAGKPYSGYPQFSSPDQLAFSLKDVGFDVLVTANNHCVDRGKKGLERTAKMLDSLGFKHTGSFVDSLSRRRNNPLIINKKGIRIAILNYTYGTNGINVRKPNIVNSLDTTIIKADLNYTKSLNPDFILVIPHWGLEYQIKQNVAQNKMSDFFFENGANAVVGSHPHVVQPVEYKVNTLNKTFSNLVAFSMGNMISNQRKRYTDSGVFFEINLIKRYNKTKIESFAFLPFWVNKTSKPKYYIIPSRQAIGNPSKYNIDSQSLNLLKRSYVDTYNIIDNVTHTDFYNKILETKEAAYAPVYDSK
ncbi:MAG: CapA family protein [Marinifilaceae bacterium]|jgi:poly-gamma-glutamate synthesis protein (capsule biosynthesis protein)|nr:CapA family protein [Marinifilaceae bacterium]